MSRSLDADPEPLIVTVGEPGWAVLARFADILLTQADRPDGAARTCGELFGSYPGLTLVAVLLPDATILIRHRGRTSLQAAARAVYFCG